MKKYEPLKMEVIEFETEDIIRTSDPNAETALFPIGNE